MSEEKNFVQPAGEEEHEEGLASPETEQGAPEESVDSPQLKGHSPVAGDEAADEEVDRLREKNAELEQENKELMNRLMRMQADFDNYRKRVRAERDDLLQNANFALIQKILPVIDNLERACTASQTGEEGIVEGLKMITKQFLEILEKEGVVPIDCVGKPFDPNCHEAVMRDESASYPANTVVEEILKGYYLHDKILRASMVKVSVGE